MDSAGEHCRRWRFTLDGEPPIYLIQALVPERKAILGDDGIEPSAAPVSLIPTDFKEISKICIHCNGDSDRQRYEAIVVNSKAIETAALPQEPSPREV